MPRLIHAAEIGLDGESHPVRMTPSELDVLESQWHENFTDACEHRNLILLRSLSQEQRLRLLAEAESRSITSFAALKRLALQMGFADASHPAFQ